MKVKDIMSSHIVTVTPDDHVQHAAELMQSHNVGSVPVCQSGSIVGIVTDRDIVLRAVAAGKDMHQARVSEVMSPHVVMTSPETELEDVGDMMSDHQIRRIPVVENSRLVGMVSLGDLSINGRYDVEISRMLLSISLKPKQ